MDFLGIPFNNHHSPSNKIIIFRMNKTNNSFLTISDLWRMCVARWRWFAVSILICLLFVYPPRGFELRRDVQGGDELQGRFGELA